MLFARNRKRMDFGERDDSTNRPVETDGSVQPHDVSCGPRFLSRGRRGDRCRYDASTAPMHSSRGAEGGMDPSVITRPLECSPRAPWYSTRCVLLRSLSHSPFLSFLLSPSSRPTIFLFFFYFYLSFYFIHFFIFHFSFFFIFCPLFLSFIFSRRRTRWSRGGECGAHVHGEGHYF